MNEDRPILLFLCVANSARSQMAEGLARRMVPPEVEVMSAGSEPGQVNLFAVRAMAEMDIDISTHHSKSVHDLDDATRARVQVVITLCADEVCPVFLEAAERHHWPHPDPAAATGSDQEILASFRAVRDQLGARLLPFLAARFPG